MLGWASEDQKQWLQARTGYRTAIVLYPIHARIHFRFGQVSERRKELRKAASDYRVAIRMRLQNPKYYSHLGLALETIRF